MKRTISSAQTFLMKIIFPMLWIPIFGIGALMAVFNLSHAAFSVAFGFVFCWIAGSAVIYWLCIRLKAVSVDENFLYVSNYIKEIRIPLGQIYDVTENRWINIRPVTIHLQTPSEFGSKIMFMPKARFFAFFSPHPIVNELKSLAEAK